MSKSVNMKSFLYFFVFFLWLSVTLITSFATNASGSWVTETVDSAGSVGGYSSIGVDSNSNVHISYRDSTNSALKYATNASGSWVTEIVDSAGNAGWFTSIAIDSNNNAHISYLDVYNSYLKYATNTSDSWVTQNISGVALLMEFSSEYTSIAVDSYGYDWVHISYCDLFDGLKYATNFADFWFTQSLDDTGVYVGMGNSIAIDSRNKVHISYFANGDLRYATGPYDPWVIQTVDTVVYAHTQFSSKENTSIAVDSNNNVHISYYDSINDDLKYATNASGAWVTETVDSAGDVGGHNSIAIDSNNNVHISYGGLKYATNASGSWVTQIVDSAGGGYTSIAIDSNNKMHISYHDVTNNDLKYATNAPIFCGNGTIEPDEQCDDGNTISGDGCSAICIIEFCGDGILQTGLGEQCDDGNTNNGDGCSATCQSEVVKVLSPNGSEVIPSGSQYTVQWGAPPEAVKFTLTYSKDNGTTWNLIAQNVTGTSYDWQVPTILNNKKQCLVKVKAFNSEGVMIGKDKSDSVFTIELVKLTSPDGGETLTSGTPHTIAWTTNATKNPVTSVKLVYTTNGSTWTLIDTPSGNPGSYNWTVPNVPSISCKVKIVLKDASGTIVGKDASDGFFRIRL